MSAAIVTVRAGARCGATLIRLGVVVLGVWLASVAAGEAVAAVAGAALTLVAGIRWWARVEARLFATTQPTAEVVGPPARVVDVHRHLAFAQALAVVASRYLAECEAEVTRPDYDAGRFRRSAPRRQGPTP
jgi:hypothetical protein